MGEGDLNPRRLHWKHQQLLVELQLQGSWCARSKGLKWTISKALNQNPTNKQLYKPKNISIECRLNLNVTICKMFINSANVDKLNIKKNIRICHLETTVDISAHVIWFHIQVLAISLHKIFNKSVKSNKQTVEIHFKSSKTLT